MKDRNIFEESFQDFDDSAATLESSEAKIYADIFEIDDKYVKEEKRDSNEVEIWREIDEVPILSGPWICELCALTFPTSSNLNRHMQSKKHLKLTEESQTLVQTGPFEYEVQPIEKKSKKEIKSRGKATKKPKNNGNGTIKRKYQCKMCEKYFFSCSNLRRHEKLHGEAKLFQCNVCDKQFMQKEYLKKHLAVHIRQH
jgi:uncharacterized Zn-finger protein